jgi:hypothetical protein
VSVAPPGDQYKSGVVGYKVPGPPQFTVGQGGWEEVADYALDWAAQKTARGRRAVSLAEGDGFDLGQLRDERAPEHAAVLGQVEPVAGGEEHPVRILVVDRNGNAYR